MILENTPTLETKRLILRKFTKDDLPQFQRIFENEQVNTFLPWFPVKSIDEARAFYAERYEKVYKAQAGYAYAICLKENNVAIGYLNLDAEAPYDLGYGLLPEFWGQGIITEAAEALVERARKDGYPYITATHDVNNPKSGEVMKRIGMTYAYSYVEQWQPKDFPATFRLYQVNFDKSVQGFYQGCWEKSSVRFKENIDE